MRLSTLFGISFVVAASSGCSEPAGGDVHLDLVFDPCRPVAVLATDASEVQLAGIERALVLWRERGDHALALGPAAGAPVLTIMFDDAAPAFRGLYDDERGIIFVNRGLTDPTAFTITVAHELGHAFGLWHVSADERSSVMNHGNVTIAPTDADQLAVEALWGPCS